jgi:hypothetical protein
MRSFLRRQTIDIAQLKCSTKLWCKPLNTLDQAVSGFHSGADFFRTWLRIG